MALKLPNIVEETLPTKTTTVLQLLAYDLPPIFQPPLDLSPENVAETFDPPGSNTSDAIAISQLPIPADSFRKRLSEFLKQSEKGTYKSLHIPWSSLEVSRTGLWLIGYWDHIERLRWLQGEWRKIHLWLQDCRNADTDIPGAHAIYDQAITNVESLFYEQELYSFRGQLASALHIASRLLSEQWVDSWTLSGIIDAFSARQQSMKQNHRSKSYILPCHILASIEGAYHASRQDNEKPFQVPKSSKPLKTWIDGGGETFFFVLNVNQNHWVAAKVNIPACCVQVGDSLRMFQGVHTALQPMLSWLSNLLNKGFTIKFGLVCGKQQDGISCGLFAANTIAFHVFSDGLLTHRRRELARASYFNELVVVHSQSVPNCLSLRNGPPHIIEPGINGCSNKMRTTALYTGSNASPGDAKLAQHHHPDTDPEVIDISDSSSDSDGFEPGKDIKPLCEELETDGNCNIVGSSYSEFVPESAAT
ncbi:hypothetical protein CTheo_8953 [Ceratobasidium theobromae]|uniref:Ubiquitin-like protease family profile domain-containing protein n=1 Tax=Ceratobasidium theobromae TaxID=1582974 RepID=A0A5N5Q882_9AGAM|nr:hypothetical protein CTheo_8953 [Ceratobasidium theobromae]